MRASLAGVLASVCVAGVAGAHPQRCAAQAASDAPAEPASPSTPEDEAAPATSRPAPAGEAEPAPPPPGEGADPAPAQLSDEDAALLKELQSQMPAPEEKAAPAPSAAPAAATAAPATGGRSNPLGLSNLYNPAISFNGLFLGALNSADPVPEGDFSTGLMIQEMELQLMSNVDPYFLANVRLSLGSGEGIGLEEGYVQPAWTPLGIQARIGKTRVPFGRENQLHTHALPFIDKSLVGTAVFGEESLGEVGLELSYLFPLPWYMVLTAGGYNGDNELQFASPNQYDLLGAASLKNLFDLTDDAALEVGLSYAAGNNAARRLAQVVGAYAMLKWRPARHFRDRGLVVVAEALYATRPNTAYAIDPALTDPSVGGAYVYAQVRLAQRWYAGARYDYLGLPNEAIGNAQRGSAILVYAPSEFSAIRLQGEATKRPDAPEIEYAALLQLNFTIGAHPAHAY